VGVNVSAIRIAGRYHSGSILSHSEATMALLDRRMALKSVMGCGLASPICHLFADDQPKTPAKVDNKSKAPAPKPDPYGDAVLIDGEPPKPAAGSFTIAVLPDTQHYSERSPATFIAQTRWIVEKQRERNICCVLHLGDITNRNTPAEWNNAVRAMHELDAHLPYFFVAGNHDYSEGGKCVDRTTRLNQSFPLRDYRGRPTFGGVYNKEPDRMENSFHLLSAGGRDFLVLALEFGPRADVIRWASDIAGRHSNREAILITHAFIYYDDTRYNWKKFGIKQNWNPHAYGIAKSMGDDVTDGEEIWDRLIARHENFIFTLNGHVLGDGLGRLTSATPGGRDVPQILVNFQMRPLGGDGWLRLMEFRADGRTVEVCDYSPTRKQRNESPQNKFTMRLAPVKKA
jgi:predicted phosphodiesterase